MPSKTLLVRAQLGYALERSGKRSRALTDKMVLEYDKTIENPYLFVKNLFLCLHYHKKHLENSDYSCLYDSAIYYLIDYYIKDSKLPPLDFDKSKKFMMAEADSLCEQFRKEQKEPLDAKHLSLFLEHHDLYLERKRNSLIMQ